MCQPGTYGRRPLGPKRAKVCVSFNGLPHIANADWRETTPPASLAPTGASTSTGGRPSIHSRGVFSGSVSVINGEKSMAFLSTSVSAPILPSPTPIGSGDIIVPARAEVKPRKVANHIRIAVRRDT